MNARSGPRTIARHATVYLVAVLSRILRSTELDLLDVLILLAISVAPPARDGAPRGISRNALSKSIHVPLETVRRRVLALLDKGLLDERAGGLVRPDGQAFSWLDNEPDLLRHNAQQLRLLFRDLKARGFRLE
jgi:hypothetical protein